MTTLLAPSRRAAARPGATIDRVDAAVYTIPTDRPESDGTLRWDATTMVLARVHAGDRWGIGYTYTDATAADLIRGILADAVRGMDAMDPPRIAARMQVAIRNIGRPGVVGAAISALDVAAWDLKARWLGISLLDLLGRAHDAVPGYGSGGFTSYRDDELRDQLRGWAASGFRRVKIKVGSEPDRDPARVEVARDAIGPDVELFVDANGAYDRKQALVLAEAFAGQGVRWFEEPVPQDDITGLRLVRDRAPAGMQIASGEYAYDLAAFRRLLEGGAVDVLQADATRCGGVTGYLQAAALCQAHNLPLSSHCAPTLHATLGCATLPTVHLEWFHDHARIEPMAFAGAPQPVDGLLRPGADAPGLGIELRETEMREFLVEGWA